MAEAPSIWKRAWSRVQHPPVLRALVWALAVGTSLLLIGVNLLEARYVPLAELPKGSVAPYTLRATHDAVYDLHETFQAEVEEVRQTYIPIYDWDEALPHNRLEPILRAALAEPLSVWKYATLPPPAAEEGGEETATDAGPPQNDAGPRPDSSDGGPGDAGFTWLAQGSGPVAERRREIESLVRGCFRLLEGYYRDGVVGDSEFPREKKTIRVLYQGEYNVKTCTASPACGRPSTGGPRSCSSRSSIGCASRSSTTSCSGYRPT